MFRGETGYYGALRNKRPGGFVKSRVVTAGDRTTYYIKLSNVVRYIYIAHKAGNIDVC